MTKALCSRLLILLTTGLLLPSLLLAASTVEIFDDSEIQESLDFAKQQLEKADTEQEVDTVRDQLPKIKSQISECISKTKQQIDQLGNDLIAIGEGAVGDTVEIIGKREDLYTQQGRVKESNFNCKELESYLEEIFSLSATKKNNLTKQRLSLHNFSVLESLEDLPNTIPAMLTRAQQALNIGIPEKRHSVFAWFIGILFAGFGLGLGFIARFYVKHWLNASKGPADNEPYIYNLLNSLNTYISWILCGLTGFIVFNSLSASGSGWNLPTRLMLILALLGAANFIFRWLCKPHSPGDILHAVNKQIPKALVKRLRATSVVVAIGFGIFGTHWLVVIPDTELRLPYQVINIALALSLLSILHIGGEFTDLKGRYRLMRLVLIVASFIAIVASLTGYINAANYLLFAALTTLVAALLLWVLLWSLDQAVDGIVNGKTKASYRLRASMGIRAEETSSELGWLRLLTGLALWAGFGLFLLFVWDFTDSSIPAVKLMATDGFNISENTKIVPKNILAGLLVFAVVLSISVWLKARLERQWLRNIGMDRGSRDAVVTLTGYMGMIIAVLMGLTAAGVSFAGLALVAGALSVGIGFGLQNIVNNFISGLILLFERPIHSGDYISVGDVEGTVKRISIRSTEIETLHRTNVIVPNSQLISGQVTNWVLHDSFGVIHVPIGVAYGSDTKLIKELLLEVAQEHKEIISRPNLQQPTVRFKGFGDSSLDFVLVTLVKSVTKRFDIISELNFAIDEKFKQHNITIPFPQRDLHFKATPEKDDTVMPEFLKPQTDEIIETPLEDAKKE